MPETGVGPGQQEEGEFRKVGLGGWTWLFSWSGPNGAWDSGPLETRIASHALCTLHSALCTLATQTLVVLDILLPSVANARAVKVLCTNLPEHKAQLVAVSANSPLPLMAVAHRRCVTLRHCAQHPQIGLRQLQKGRWGMLPSDLPSHIMEPTSQVSSFRPVLAWSSSMAISCRANGAV
jgi:hypothetical protein